jgi:integrase
MASFSQRANGNWQAKITRQGITVDSKTFQLKEDAQKWARATERKMDIGTFVKRDDTKTKTFGELAKKYELEVLIHKKSIQQSKSVIKILTEEFGKKMLSAITPELLIAYRNKRLLYVQPQTVVHELNMITRIYTSATKEWGISIPLGNPMVHVTKPKIDGERDRRLEDGEWEVLKERLLKCKSPVVLSIVEFAIETAARQSEILSLKWDDVNLPTQTAKLRGIDGRSTKNNDWFRPVPLSRKAIEVIGVKPSKAIKKTPVFKTTQSAFAQSWERAVDSARKDYLHDLLKAKLDELGIDGNAQIRAMIYKKREPLPIALKLFKEIESENSMLHDFHFHDLRHEAISRLATKLEMHELMKVTGHKSSAMLIRYYHPKISDLAKKIN